MYFSTLFTLARYKFPNREKIFYRKHELKTFAVTQWVERHDILLVFLELLELIVGDLDELNQVVGVETASKANQLIHVLFRLHLL